VFLEAPRTRRVSRHRVQRLLGSAPRLASAGSPARLRSAGLPWRFGARAVPGARRGKVLRRRAALRSRRRSGACESSGIRSCVARGVLDCATRGSTGCRSRAKGCWGRSRACLAASTPRRSGVDRRHAQPAISDQAAADVLATADSDCALAICRLHPPLISRPSVSP
jgi:hypothetical protein